MALSQDFFTKYGITPDYKDSENLARFLTPRKKLMSREKTGLTAKNQRALTKQIKYARFLALLPYISYHGM